MDMTSRGNQMDVHLATTLASMQSELLHCRMESDKLRKINRLYQRMTGVLDLPAMIEAYSIWLMEHVDHELIGYRNPLKDRMHMFCSYHGPKRRQAIQLAQDLLHNKPHSAQTVGFTSHKWAFNVPSAQGSLVILLKDRCLSELELSFIDESLDILSEMLVRVLRYEEVITLASQDSLTGLPNRVIFAERIEQIMEQAKRHTHPLTLVALDLDHFKAVNDTMGHLMGDKVLCQVASALHEQIRLTDLLVRMGGDEFLLVLPDTDLQAAQHLAERLCLAVDALNIQTTNGRLAVSIGLSQWQPGMSLQAWMEEADDILYQAKANGRAQVAIH